ncbi:hypothetical protein LS68_009235 [Helicobacter sp. MIT 05-5293]|uniref:hypothetical protein n=1 Tax=unclassified Helicobacter TaxID=2593540 RepID=UPI00051DF01B|nr:MULTISPECIES: hypothetical protein [unclassified Helicobacter]TLD79844.1 hypothetical protein LS68_009235 [Helicobacter sp. MIT 05-5293]TLD85428.1 hypothetical protein LS69_009625 [Helicobacter sp. MIT 05-5294]
MFVFYDDKDFLRIDLTHRDTNKHPITRDELIGFVRDYCDFYKIEAYIQEVIENNIHSALLTDEGLNPTCPDCVFILSDKKVLANCGCVIFDYKVCKEWGEEKIFSFLSSVYDKEVIENPLGWKLYARRVKVKLDDIKELL